MAATLTHLLLILKIEVPLGTSESSVCQTYSYVLTPEDKGQVPHDNSFPCLLAFGTNDCMVVRD